MMIVRSGWVAALFLVSAGASAEELELVTDVLPVAHAGEPYAVQLQAAGGLPPYTWSAAPLPAGLELRSDRIEGTPSSPDDHRGPTLVELAVHDRRGDEASWVVGLTVIDRPRLELVKPPGITECRVGAQVSIRAVAQGGTPPYAWRVDGTPAGVDCPADTGVAYSCWGWPLQSGEFHVLVRVADAGGETVEAQEDLECIDDPPEIGPAELLCANVGLPYEEQLLSDYSSVHFSVVAGALPPGITLESSGAFRGTVPGGARVHEVFRFRVRADHDRAGSSEREMAIQTAPASEACAGPDPERPGDGPGSGSAGSGGDGDPGGTSGSLASGARSGAPRGGCDCSSGSGGWAAALACAIGLRRRRGSHPVSAAPSTSERKSGSVPRQ
jgi:hypothetical protein